MERVISFCGILLILGICFLFSSSRKSIDYRIIFGGISLQAILALIILKTSFGHMAFEIASSAVTALIGTSDKGAEFVFGPNFRDHFYAFKVLPTIIFMSALSSILFYLGIIQKIIDYLAWVMAKIMNLSGSESLVGAANIFLGQTEAPLLIKPYLKTMTKSEILTMMTSGMATVSGGILAAYVGLGISAGHLLAASVMSAPASILIAKTLFPELEKSPTKGKNQVHAFIERESNVFEAACNGASSGLQMALNVGAMLITFVALVYLGNTILGAVSGYFLATPLSFEFILGTFFRPLAFMIGISWEDSYYVGQLLGQKIILNEFMAYTQLAEFMKQGVISERAISLATYALCGFANLSSIAIQIGGIGALVPEKKPLFAYFGFRALLGGTLSGLMTACMAGLIM